MKWETRIGNCCEDREMTYNQLIQQCNESFVARYKTISSPNIYFWAIKVYTVYIDKP